MAGTLPAELHVLQGTRLDSNQHIADQKFYLSDCCVRLYTKHNNKIIKILLPIPFGYLYQGARWDSNPRIHFLELNSM